MAYQKRERNLSGAKWQSVDLVAAIHDLESKGYWKEGTTKSILQNGVTLWSPTHEYRKKQSGSLNGFDPLIIEQELRMEIKRHLDKCKGWAMPKVCARIQTKEGYKAMEFQVIKMMISGRITAGAAISQIEVDLV